MTLSTYSSFKTNGSELATKTLPDIWRMLIINRIKDQNKMWKRFETRPLETTEEGIAKTRRSGEDELRSDKACTVNPAIFKPILAELLS